MRASAFETFGQSISVQSELWVFCWIDATQIFIAQEQTSISVFVLCW